MAVRIRLKRTGGKNKPCYRVVVADARFQRDGRFIENIGFYDPVHDSEKLNVERADYWIGCGAQPSKTVADIIRRAKNPVKKEEEETAKTKKKTKAVAKAESTKEKGKETSEKPEEIKPDTEVVEKKAEAEEKPQEEKQDEKTVTEKAETAEKTEEVQ